MLIRFCKAVVCLSLLTILLAVVPDSATSIEIGRAAAEPNIEGEFTVDKTHSVVLFRLRQFGVSYFYGRLTKPSGTFLIDDGDLASSHVHIIIDVKNMDSGDAERDRFLKGPDFFNAREFPTAEFKSKSISKIEDGVYEATGEFTMHGVTRALTARLDDVAEGPTARFGYRGGFECTFEVNRSDYGVDWFLDSLSDRVRITAAIGGRRE